MNHSALSSTLTFLRTNVRWLASGMMLTIFSGFGQVYFISLFGRSLRESLSLNSGQLGGIFMLSTLASAASFLLVGRLVDCYPARCVAVGACIVLSAACLGMYFLSSVWMLLLVLYALRLVGQGLLPHIAMVCMGRWYVAERGRAVAIASMGHQLGAAVIPLLVVTLIAWLGWRHVWLIGSLCLLVIALPGIYLLMRVERVPRSSVAESHQHEPPRQWTYREVARDTCFWGSLAFMLMPAFTGTSIIFHQAHISEVKGWSASLFAGGMSAMSIGNVLVALVTGQVVDRQGACRLLPCFLLPFASACVLLSVTEQAWGLVAVMALLGMSTGMSTILSGALLPEIYGTQYLGSIRALLTSSVVLATAVGPGLSGWLIDRGAGIETMLQVVAVYSLLGVWVLWRMSRILGRRQSVVS